jgi:hypothetical protein
LTTINHALVTRSSSDPQAILKQSLRKTIPKRSSRATRHYNVHTP